MNEPSDALMFFGFPALYGMVKSGRLNAPVIALPDLDELRVCTASVDKHVGKSILPPFEKLARLLRYVRGDYHDPATFQALRKGNCHSPLRKLKVR